MHLEEGVVKFKQEFKDKLSLESKIILELNFWRGVLYKKGLIGRDLRKYNGFGYGNVSQRLGPYSLPVNKRKFVITGSQTEHLPILNEKYYAVVHEYYPKENLVVVGGLIQASSESMTHGAIYDLDYSIRSVFHIHSPQLWNYADRLGISQTRKDVKYGTPAMTEEVHRLYKETNLRNLHIFSMGGHQDGIFTFGKNTNEAGLTLLRYLSTVKKLSFSQ